MRAFEVYLNKKKLCIAGIGNDGVLDAMVNWVARGGRGDLFLDVGGLVSPAEEFVRWVNQRPLRVGDQVHIKIIEADAVDKPIKRWRPDPAEELKSKKRYVRRMAKELGWKIQVQSK